MTIIWNEKFLIDNGTIDRDHRDLIRIINKFSGFNHDKFIVPNIKETLAELKLYTIRHFEREEKIQIEIGYPMSETHSRQHIAMIDQLDQIIAEFRDAIRLHSMKYNEIRDKIFRLLKIWLVQHIMVADTSMKPYFENGDRKNAA